MKTYQATQEAMKHMAPGSPEMTQAQGVLDGLQTKYRTARQLGTGLVPGAPRQAHILRVVVADGRDHAAGDARHRRLL